MIVLIGVPLLLLAFGLICEKADKKLLFCIAAGAAVFAECGIAPLAGFFGADTDRIAFWGTVIDSFDPGALGMIDAPPAYLLIMKLCSAAGADASAFPIFIACLQSVIAAYALGSCCSEPYSAASVLTFCFVPVHTAGSALFTAALICITASGYVRERRFFRYCAVILAAACFDTSALLLIPLYFVMIIKPVAVSAVVSVVIAVLASLLPDAVGAVYDLLGNGLYAPVETQVLPAVIVVIAAVLILLMYAMFKNRDGHYETLVPTFVCGASLTAAAVSDSRLSGAALMLMMQSAVVLAPEAHAIGTRFVEILFPKDKKTAGRIFLAVCAALGAGICVYLVLGDLYGAQAYDKAISEVITL